MRIWHLIALVFLAPVPANACSMPPMNWQQISASQPREKQPSETELLRTKFESYDSIVSGVVEGEGPVIIEELVSFRVQRVFKGKAKVGDVLLMDTNQIYASRGCPPSAPQFPYLVLRTKTPYVVGFREAKPRFNEIDQHDFDIMLGQGWITSAR